MSTQFNPYNYNLPARPENFVGRWDVVEEIVTDLHSPMADSWAIIGGRRFGKSSLLKAIEWRLNQQREAGDGHVVAVPFVTDLKRCPDRSEEAVYACVLRSIVRAGGKRDYLSHLRSPVLEKSVTRNELSFYEFEELLETAISPTVANGRVPRWILMLDEVESKVHHPWAETFFNQLRSMIYDGPLADYLKIILTGSALVTKVRSQGSPLLNAVKLKYLEVLTKPDIVQLIERGCNLPTEISNIIWHECGGHPFVAQYLLFGIWQTGGIDVTQSHIDEISHQMRVERNADFSDWWESLGDSGQRAYSVLSDGGGRLRETTLLKELQGCDQLPSEGLSALCYHGLAAFDRATRTYAVAGLVFQKWYRENIAQSSIGTERLEPRIRNESRIEGVSSESGVVEVPKRFGHGYALLIGVGSGDLPNTVDDAQVLSDILSDPSRCAYPPDQVRLLTSEKSTRANILSELDWLSAATKDDEDATVVFFFSGHGGYMPNYHIVPHGYNSQVVESTAISGEELTVKLAAILCKKLLILLDCCHAGGIVDLHKQKSFEKSPYPPGIDKFLASGSGRVMIASSRRDEVSYAGAPYSVFTQAIVEGLAGYGASETDGYSYVADLALYAGRVVSNRTSDSQHPILKLSAADNFPVSYYAGGAKKPLPLGQSLANFRPVISASPVDISDEIVEGYLRIVRQHKLNLLRIEERMARFIDQAAVPLDLERQKQDTLAKIVELEQNFKV